MERRAALRTLGALGCIGVAGCVSPPALGGVDYDVGMSANAFEPLLVEINVGETITWKNTGSRAHTVTAYEDSIPDEASFFATGDFENEDQARHAWHHEEGGNLYGGETWRYTFEVPGMYSYFCVPHEPRGMVGQVEVTD